MGLLRKAMHQDWGAGTPESQRMSWPRQLWSWRCELRPAVDRVSAIPKRICNGGGCGGRDDKGEKRPCLHWERGRGDPREEHDQVGQRNSSTDAGGADWRTPRHAEHEPEWGAHVNARRRVHVDICCG